MLHVLHVCISFTPTANAVLNGSQIIVKLIKFEW